MNRRTIFQSGRRKSLHCNTVGLQFNKLERLLSETLPSHFEAAADSELSLAWPSHSRTFSCVGLAHAAAVNNGYGYGHGRAQQVISEVDSPLSTDDIENIVGILGEAVQVLSLPSCLVAYIHSCIGLLRQLQGEYQCAIQSLLKALWLETSSFDPADAIQVGLTLHRLAISYRKCGDPKQAVALLNKAMVIYSGSGFSNDHAFIINALEEKEYAQEQLPPVGTKLQRQWHSGVSCESHNGLQSVVEEEHGSVQQRSLSLLESSLHGRKIL